LKDKLLFIPFVIFEKCSIPFKLWILWLLFEKFLCWENGVLQVTSRKRNMTKDCGEDLRFKQDAVTIKKYKKYKKKAR